MADYIYSVILKKKILLVIIILSLICILSLILLSNQTIEIPKAKYFKDISIDNTIKTILYWNTFFGVEDMYFGTGSDIFKNCPVQNCYATFDKHYEPIQNYDAIIFHGPRYSVRSDTVPKLRSIHQKYIFYSLESPYNSYFDPAVDNNFYNWTMTYRNDSDIYSPYRLTVKSKIDYNLPDITKKTKKIAWFVSNCATEGSIRRLKYAQELNKYIPVDIYGECGNFTCTDRVKCYEMLEKDYKFYLSFENSVCEDYVTEKLFNILEYNVVPIVLGYFDYSTIAPPNSVINTIDFREPKSLAEYLWTLDKNSDLYLEYFKWKSNYKIISSTEYTLCELCRKLNEPIKYESIENIKDWFFGFHCFK